MSMLRHYAALCQGEPLCCIGTVLLALVLAALALPGQGPLPPPPTSSRCAGEICWSRGVPR